MTAYGYVGTYAIPPIPTCPQPPGAMGSSGLCSQGPVRSRVNFSFCERPGVATRPVRMPPCPCTGTRPGPVPVIGSLRRPSCGERQGSSSRMKSACASRGVKRDRAPSLLLYQNHNQQATSTPRSASPSTSTHRTCGASPPRRTIHKVTQYGFTPILSSLLHVQSTY